MNFKYRLQITKTKTNSIYVFQKLIINNETLKKIAHTENNLKVDSKCGIHNAANKN